MLTISDIHDNVKVVTASAILILSNRFIVIPPNLHNYTISMLLL